MANQDRAPYGTRNRVAAVKGGNDGGRQPLLWEGLLEDQRPFSNNLIFNGNLQQ